MRDELQLFSCDINNILTLARACVRLQTITNGRNSQPEGKLPQIGYLANGGSTILFVLSFFKKGKR